MKRGVTILVLLFLSIIAAGIVAAPNFEECSYDSKYDMDGDFRMSRQADCGASYQYDCDDSNKDIYKDCRKPFWTRLVEWLKGEDNTVKQKIDSSHVITGNTIKKIIPKEMPGRAYSEEDEEDVPGSSVPSTCSVTICLKSNMKEVYCPLSYSECTARYSGCRAITCENEYCEDDEEEVYATETYTVDTGVSGSSGECDEEYHDCYDAGEAVVCKGSFAQCDASFDDCSCGTSDGSASYGGEATPDIDTSETINCSTGVYVCDRQQLTMSGDLASSTVTCKSSFSACSMLYGNCRCGNSTLTDFPTQYIGSASIPSLKNAQNYWCDYKGKQVPCYMLPGNCTRKKNTCNKGGDIWINCEGSFDFCQKQYGECLCGVESLGTGFMKTSSD